MDGKKLVFFDIDGTIFDFSHLVCESTKNAIHRLAEQGIYTALCSGRSRARIYDDHFLNFGVRGVVAGCGTYVEWDGDILLNYLIPSDLAEQSVYILREHRLVPTLAGDKYTYFDLDEYVEGIDSYRNIVIKMQGSRLKPITGNEKHLRYNKISAKKIPGSDVEGVIQALSPWYSPINHRDATIEFVPNGFSKATGMDILAQYLGISRENIYAFGDSRNDVEMLRYAGHSVMMGNGLPDLAKEVEYVTSSHYEGGIEEGLRYFHLL